MPPRGRPRQAVVELPGTDEVPEAFAAPASRARSASQVRRVQEAAADAKTRLPKDQRAAERADGHIYAPIAGKQFRLSPDGIGLMPLMEWAAAQDGELDIANNAVLVSFYRVLKDLVHPDDWQAFRVHTRDERCNDEDFLNFQNAAIEALAARPTAEPAAS